MKYFKDSNNDPHAFEDDVTDEWIEENRPNLISITESEASVVGSKAYAKNISTHDDYVVSTVGDLPDTHVSVERTSDNHVWNDTTEQWEEDATLVAAALEVIRNAKIDELRDECGVKIEAGIETDVIHGYPVHYRLQMADQLKINNAAASATGGKIWRNEVFEQTSQANAITLKGLADAHIESMTNIWAGKYAYLIVEARTQAEIEAVTWTSSE